MQNEEQLRRILLNLLKIGLLRIRAFAWDGRIEECAVEADHLHNLPHIASEMKMELVSFYYNAERPAFIKRATHIAAFEKDWEELGGILTQIESVNPKL
jgi:hypothetical protein